MNCKYSPRTCAACSSCTGWAFPTPGLTHSVTQRRASYLKGAPLTVVQRQPRHGDAKTTLQKHGHVVGDSQRRAVNSLAEKIERHAVELESTAELEPSAA